MVIGRHYTQNGKWVYRTLFNCRECDRPCTPIDFVPIKDSGLLIATAYGCRHCSCKFVTSTKVDNEGK